MTDLEYSESIHIRQAPEDVYDMVSDVTRMGEWSPICTGCWWDEGAGPVAGAWFTGRNEIPGRTWDTRSVILAADRGREFAFAVGGSLVRWAYTLAPMDGGTELTESWEFLADGIAYFEERFGADAPVQIANRTEAARRSIPETLAAIKRSAEGHHSLSE